MPLPPALGMTLEVVIPSRMSGVPGRLLHELHA
jgi:hypothetical protein